MDRHIMRQTSTHNQKTYCHIMRRTLINNLLRKSHSMLYAEKSLRERRVVILRVAYFVLRNMSLCRTAVLCRASVVYIVPTVTAWRCVKWPTPNDIFIFKSFFENFIFTQRTRRTGRVRRIQRTAKCMGLLFAKQTSATPNMDSVKVSLFTL